MTVVVVGGKKVERRLRGIGARAQDLRPVLRAEVEPDIERFYERQFQTEGTEGGTPWKPLSAKTILARRRAPVGRALAGFSAVLRDRLRLYRSLTQPGPEAIRVFKRRSVERGTIVPYAAAHDSPKKGRLPKREIAPDPMPKKYSDRFANRILRYIVPLRERERDERGRFI